MILTQREGTAAVKVLDQSTATVTADGRLVASQAAPETTTYVIFDQMNEPAAKTTPFRYENGVLCATFPEMGVTLNSMVRDKETERQRDTERETEGQKERKTERQRDIET